MDYKSDLLDSEIIGEDSEYNDLFGEAGILSDHQEHVRKFIDLLWSNYKHLADLKFRTQIRSKFHSCYFEMYLANCLLANKAYTLSSSDFGPDIFIKELDTWIECVSATNGDPNNPDSVPEDICYDPNDSSTWKAEDVPDKKIILRYTNSFFEKQKKIVGYINSGQIKRDQPVIIAISGAKVSSARTEQGYPKILGALFPIGDRYITYDKNTMEVVKEGIRYSDAIKKNNESLVDKLAFASAKYDFITGVIFSLHDVWNHECLSKLGADLIYIPNPFAKNLLPANFLGVGRYCEICFQENEFEIITHTC